MSRKLHVTASRNIVFLPSERNQHYNPSSLCSNKSDIDIYRSTRSGRYIAMSTKNFVLTTAPAIVALYTSVTVLAEVIHHLLSVFAISYALYSGEGQLYTFLVLISETTTPGINLRWFLDTAGMKRSKAYLVNGVVMFFAWVVARILLFIYLFYHVYHHYDQIEQMDIFAYILVFSVPSILVIMNMMWFGKILRGLKKTLAKKQ